MLFSNLNVPGRAEDIEARLSFGQAKLDAARIILDAAYSAAESHASHDVVSTLYYAAEQVLEARAYEVERPRYSPRPVYGD